MVHPVMAGQPDPSSAGLAILPYLLTGITSDRYG